MAWFVLKVPLNTNHPPVIKSRVNFATENERRCEQCYRWWCQAGADRWRRETDWLCARRAAASRRLEPDLTTPHSKLHHYQHHHQQWYWRCWDVTALSVGVSDDAPGSCGQARRGWRSARHRTVLPAEAAQSRRHLLVLAGPCRRHLDWRRELLT